MLWGTFNSCPFLCIPCRTPQKLSIFLCIFLSNHPSLKQPHFLSVCACLFIVVVFLFSASFEQVFPLCVFFIKYFVQTFSVSVLQHLELAIYVCVPHNALPYHTCLSLFLPVGLDTVGPVPIWSICLMAGLALALVVFFTSKDDKAPVYHEVTTLYSDNCNTLPDR